MWLSEWLNLSQMTICLENQNNLAFVKFFTSDARKESTSGSVTLLCHRENWLEGMDMHFLFLLPFSFCHLCRRENRKRRKWKEKETCLILAVMLCWRRARFHRDKTRHTVRACISILMTVVKTRLGCWEQFKWIFDTRKPSMYVHAFYSIAVGCADFLESFLWRFKWKLNLNCEPVRHF